MSYTAPQYVDTKEQAILALASTIKGEAVTGGDGSVNRALDVLADVLAEQDVQVPQTDAGAILALADYVSGGGGGGDFTTAIVTIVNSTSSPINVMMAATVDSIEEGSRLMPLFDVNKKRTATLLAALYKGHGIAVFTSGTLSIEGSADDLGDGAVDVAGDCTITVS